MIRAARTSMVRAWLAESRQPRYQVCTTCIMDTSDPEIWFGDDGRCVHCRRLSEELALEEFGAATELYRRRRLEWLADAMAVDGRHGPYDCIAGVDGGVASTYAVWLAWSLGLRVLALHVDTGWNSPEASDTLIRLRGVESVHVETVPLDRADVNDLLRAFLRSSTPDAGCPLSHAVSAVLFQTACRLGLRSIIVGSARPTARIMPTLWKQGEDDWRYIRSVHRRFGGRRLGAYPHWGWFRMQRWLARGIRVLPLVELAGVGRTDAIAGISRSWGWSPATAPARASAFRAFLRDDWLPRKFGFELDRADLSTGILRGALSRADALRELDRRKPDPASLTRQRAAVAGTLGLAAGELEAMLSLPPRTIHDYPNERDAFDRDDAPASIRWIGDRDDPA